MLVKEKIWKCIFDTNSEWYHNCTEKQIMPFKTTVNWLFNDIWCYLVIGCFNWKICIFQQTDVSVYYVLNFFMNWALNVGCMLFDTLKHHHTVAHFTFSIFGSMSRPRSLYVLFLWSIFHFRCYFHCQWFYNIKTDALVYRTLFRISLTICEW